MKKHFFLEGPIQEGKSTLIRALIRDHLPQTGGFCSQRLLNESGKTVGFRIVPAAEAMSLTAQYSSKLSDIFLYFDGEKTEVRPDVFSGSAVKYLRESKGKKLVLLDEIGGIELLEPHFRKEVYEILRGAIPCLGVLKLEKSNRNMCENAKVDHDCTDRLLRLKEDLISSFHADIVPFQRKSAEKAEAAAKAFVDAVFRESRE